MRRKYKWRKLRKCPVCEKEFMPYMNTSKFCSGKCHNRKYVEWLRDNPLKYKAHCLSSKVKGRTRDDIEKLIKEALNTLCKYCQETLTLKNVSLDHRNPMYWQRKKTKEQIKELNQLDNLQIVCKRCNFIKSSFTDEEYQRLLVFLKNEPEIEKKLIKRIWVSPYKKR